MHEHTLPFGKVIGINEHLAEIIINEGVELTSDIVEQLHEFLEQTFSGELKLLFNNRYSFSYSFTAQRQLADLPNINKVALLVYNQLSERATEGLLCVRRLHPWNARIFRNRELALTWLTQLNETEQGTYIQQQSNNCR